MLYAKYRDLRDAAWHTLLSYGASELPIHPEDIARKLGVVVLQKRDADFLPDGALGMAILQVDQWYILYDQSQPRELARVVTAHELGHILLGHDLSEPSYCRTFRIKDDQERDADMFALRLLMPACVLWALHLHTAEEIAAICQVPIEQAQRRAERMASLYSRNDFLTSPLERQLYDNFKQFIQSNKINL